MTAIAKQIRPYDVVCLQEIWFEGDRKLVKSLTSDELPHTHFFKAGVFGTSGLLVLSRYPLSKAQWLDFSLTGHPLRPHEADFFAGKGIGAITVAAPLGPVAVFTTHCVARYRTNDYIEQRTIQFYEISEFMAGYVVSGEPTVFMGDLNSEPNDQELILLKELTGLTDAWVNPAPCITLARDVLVDGKSRCVDYVLIRNIRSLSSDIVCRFIRDGSPDILSDHAGVTATLTTEAPTVPVRAEGAPPTKEERERLAALKRRQRLAGGSEARLNFIVTGKQSKEELVDLTASEVKRTEVASVANILRSCVQTATKKAAAEKSNLIWRIVKMTLMILLLSAFTDLLSATYIVGLLLLPIVLHLPYILWERKLVELAHKTYADYQSKHPSQADAQQAFRSSLASATST